MKQQSSAAMIKLSKNELEVKATNNISKSKKLNKTQKELVMLVFTLMTEGFS